MRVRTCCAIRVRRARRRAGTALVNVYGQVVESKVWTNCSDRRAFLRSPLTLRRFESGRKSHCVSSSACNRSAAVIGCCPIMKRSHDGRREAVLTKNDLAGSRGFPVVAGTHSDAGTRLARVVATYSVEALASGDILLFGETRARGETRSLTAAAARSSAVRSITVLEVRP